MNKLITNRITLILLCVIICPFTVKAQDSLKKVIVVVRPGGVKPATPSTTSPAINPSQISASPALLASNSAHLAASPASHLAASPAAENDAKPTTAAQKSNNSAAPGMASNAANGITTTTTKTVTTVTTTTVTVVTAPAKAVVQYIAPGSRPTGYIAPSTAERTDPSFYMHRPVVTEAKNTTPVMTSAATATKNITPATAGPATVTKNTTPVMASAAPVNPAASESLAPVGQIATPVDQGTTAFRSAPVFLADAVGINTIKIAIDTPVKLVVRPGINDSTAKKDTLLAKKDTTNTDSLMGKHRSNKILFAELGGAGIAISINYDSRFKGGQKDGFGYRIGVGYFAAGNNTVFTIPLQVNYLLGKDGKYLELGLGTTFVNSRGDNYSSPVWEFDTVTGLSGTATIGFRYEPNHALNFRIGYVPIVSCYGLTNAGGFSVGYTF